MDIPIFYKFKPFEGPQRFVWQDPDTGQIFTSPTKAHLVARIVAYRDQNNLPQFDHLNLVLENYWCSLPENRHKCVPMKSSELKRGFLPMLQGGIAVLKNFLFSSFESQEVADARSEQCAQCPENIFHDKGPFIEFQNRVAIASVGDRQSSKHDDLGECAVCGCPLKALVWTTEPTEPTVEQVKRYEKVDCWRLKNLK